MIIINSVSLITITREVLEVVNFAKRKSVSAATGPGIQPSG